MDLLALYTRLDRWPGGRAIFSRAVCFKAPYFATIAPRVHALAPRHCRVSFPHRRAVTNHLGTIHAIALCNSAELAAGLAMETTLPHRMRWIPKGMQVEYLHKAVGTMTATASIAGPLDFADGQEVPVPVEVADPSGRVVFRATVAMWVSPRPQHR